MYRNELNGLEDQQNGLPPTDPARVAKLRLGDLLFELLRAEKYVSNDDSLSVLSVFVPALHDAGLEARHVDIYVEYADGAEIVDVRRSLMPSAELTRAVQDNAAHLKVIERTTGKTAKLTLVCLSCDASRKRQLLEQNTSLRVIDAAELRLRLERLGLRVSANWTEGAQKMALTDALRSLSQAAMSNASTQRNR